MQNDDVEYVFWVYQDFSSIVNSFGIKQVVHDLKKYYPDLFAQLKEEINYIEKVKKVGALLVDPSRRSGTGMENPA